MNSEKEKKHRKVVFTSSHLAWGITAAIVLCVSIAFYLALTKMPSVADAIDQTMDVMTPLIIGAVMAYLLLPVYNFQIRKLVPLMTKAGMSKKNSLKISKGISTILSLVLLGAILAGLILMAGPQVLQSITDMVRAMPSNVDDLSDSMTKILKDYPEILSAANQAVERLENSFLGIITDYVMPSVNILVTGITTGVISILKLLLNIVIGVMVCAYVLNNKDTFAAQLKKLIYSLFSTEKANTLIEDGRSIHRIFSGFIWGKLLDSLIIGMISFIVLSIMNMPYVIMISIFVGATNVIPFFGPFIGAIPSALIIFTVSPLQALYFLIYILVIQQLDGNVIGPKILGDSTGLPSFWVLFSITVGGGFFGFAGMLLGVPVFATICMFINKGVERSLNRRGIPVDTENYYETGFIDPETGKMEVFDEDEMPPGAWLHRFMKESSGPDVRQEENAPAPDAGTGAEEDTDNVENPDRDQQE